MDDFEHLKRLCERRKQVGSVPWIAGNKSSMNAKVEIDRIDGLIVEEVMKLYEKDDVAEVVRCRDCRFFHNGYDETCCINHKGVVVTDEFGFCHHAKRRADNG